MNQESTVHSARAALLRTTAAPALLLFAWFTAGAQGAVPPDTGVKIGTVIVTATRSTTTLQQMPLHASVIPREEIRNSPAQTLDQLMRDISGMNFPGAPYYTTDPTGHQTKMRGVTNSKVLVLVDGIPVHDPFYGTTQWFKMPLSSIDRVEVVRGGNSSLWGNTATAGVINVITKKPFDDSGQLDVAYQTFNTLNVAAAKNFMLGNGLALRVSGDMLSTNGYQTTPAAYVGGLPGKGPSSATNGNALVAAYYTPSADFSGFLRAGWHQQNEDIGGYAHGTNLQQSPDAAAGFTRIFSDRTRADVRLWTQYESFDKYNGAGCYLASATNCNATSTTSPLVQYYTSHDDNPYREFGGTAIFSLTARSGLLSSIQTGLDYRTVSGTDHQTIYNKPTTTDITQSTINRTGLGAGVQQFIGAFAQLTSSPIARLSVTLSLRGDYWGNTNGVAQTTKYTNGTAGAPSGGSLADTHEGSFNPSLSVRYAIDDHFSLRTAAYKAFHAPGLNNLYRSFASSTSITLANPTLSPETLTGGEFGVDFTAANLTLGATWFQYDTKALIASYKIQNAASAPAPVVAICGSTLSNCPATVNFNTNGQNALSQGLEFTADWRVARDATLTAAYTYTDSHYTSTTTGDPTGKQLGAIPKNLATLGMSWQLTRKWGLYASGRYNDSMFLDVNGTIPQKSFILVNASTSYQIARQLELYLAGVNLTSVRYVDSGTTSTSSETLGLPLSLTSGFRWKF